MGLITYCLCALGKKFTKFLIRSVSRDLCSKVDLYGWHSFVRLSPEAKKDLRWFWDNLSCLNGCEMVKGTEAISFNAFFAGDASALGGYLGDMIENSTLIYFPFTSEEMLGSSTMRELLVLFKFYCHTDLKHLTGLSIVHYCDNRGVAAIMAKGSPVNKLHHLAREILISC